MLIPRGLLAAPADGGAEPVDVLVVGSGVAGLSAARYAQGGIAAKPPAPAPTAPTASPPTPSSRAWSSPPTCPGRLPSQKGPQQRRVGVMRGPGPGGPEPGGPGWATCGPGLGTLGRCGNGCGG
jgi:hypothetical protein